MTQGESAIDYSRNESAAALRELVRAVAAVLAGGAVGAFIGTFGLADFVAVSICLDGGGSDAGVRPCSFVFAGAPAGLAQSLSKNGGTLPLFSENDRELSIDQRSRNQSG